MVGEIILTNNQPSTFVEPLIINVINGCALKSTHVDLRNTSPENPVVIPILDENEAKLTPLRNNAMSNGMAYLVQLADDTTLVVKLIRADNGNIHSRISLVFKKNDHTLRVHQYRTLELSPNNLKKIKGHINKLDIFFNNRSRIYDYINKIALYPPREISNDDILIIDTRYNKGASAIPYGLSMAEGRTTIVTPNIIRILNYADIIENLDDVTLEEQYEFIRFFRNNLYTPIHYKDFIIIRRFSSISVKFLGIILLTIDEKYPTDTYFKYFRHRGASFLARALDREEFERKILVKSLKDQVN